jgi:hypothetical protein
VSIESEEKATHLFYSIVAGVFEFGQVCIVDLDFFCRRCCRSLLVWRRSGSSRRRERDSSSSRCSLANAFTLGRLSGHERAGLEAWMGVERKKKQTASRTNTSTPSNSLSLYIYTASSACRLCPQERDVPAAAASTAIADRRCPTNSARCRSRLAASRCRKLSRSAHLERVSRQGSRRPQPTRRHRSRSAREWNDRSLASRAGAPNTAELTA